MGIIKRILGVAVVLAFLCGGIFFIVYNIDRLIEGAIILGCAFLLLIVFAGFISSKNKTFWGQLRDGISYLFVMIAKFFAEASYEIGTPSSEKKRIKAEERHSWMLTMIKEDCKYFTPELCYKDFKNDFDILKIDRDNWLAEAYPIWYKAFLEKAFFAKNNSYVLQNIKSFDKEKKLEETLLYFGITQEEWENNDAKIQSIINS